MSRVAPFLKWAGGKGQVADEIRVHLHATDSTGSYFEPFLGGGSVFFSVRPNRATLSDVNRPLIETYRLVKNRVSELIAELERLPDRVTETIYTANRTRLNDLIPRCGVLSKQELLEMGALFIWVNHTCYNGLFRVNSSGRFNVPFGHTTHPTVYNAKNLRAASGVLKASRARLLCCDYADALRLAKAGDQVYMDPPYQVGKPAGSFSGYTSRKFDLEEQRRLVATVRILVKKGCNIVLSNSSDQETSALYDEFESVNLPTSRTISCVGNDRGPVKELLVIARGSPAP